MATLKAGSLALATGLLIACSSNSETKPGTQNSASPNEPGYGDGPVQDRTLLSFFDEIPSCAIEHRGVAIDFGTEGMVGRVESASELEPVERNGATWSTIVDKELSATFTLVEPKHLFLSARLAPLSGKALSLYIDGVPLGSAKFSGEDARTVTTATSADPFDAGEHKVLLRFRGKPRSSEALALIDWLRIGWPDDEDSTYGAPTLADVLQADAVIGKTPHRALRLRTPTTVRCSLRVPKGARFRTALGLLGNGEGDAEVVLRRDGKEPISLFKRHLKSSESWEDIDAPLDPFAGEIVHLEFKGMSATKGSRVLFGDPVLLVSTREPEPVPAAQVVVLVLWGGVTRDELPGYGDKPAHHLDNLGKFADSAAVYMQHRASVSTAGGNLATLLTGLPAAVHTVTDLGSALPKGVPTITQRARDAGIQTALFTDVPTSFRPYGFYRSMTRFVSISPAEGESRSALLEAASFVTSTLEREPTARIFLVVHAEGGHPPWAPTPKQVDALPPEKYTGDIQPRRAGQQLASLRRKKKRVRLPEGDRIRVEALHQLALAEQDAAFGKLIEALANVEERSLVVVTNDISSGVDNYFPEELPFDEASLKAPLYIAYPSDLAEGRMVEEATSTEDVATTLAAALGVPLRGAWGRDLYRVTSGLALETSGVRYALFGETHTARWDQYLLREKPGSFSQICDLSIDWSCSFDRRPVLPLLSAALRQRHADFERRAKAVRFERETAELDDETSAALRIWGALQ